MLETPDASVGPAFVYGSAVVVLLLTAAINYTEQTSSARQKSASAECRANTRADSTAQHTSMQLLSPIAWVKVIGNFPG
jgi:hypothetical protein